jgi:hypothetical protein
LNLESFAPVNKKLINMETIFFNAKYTAKCNQ